MKKHYSTNNNILMMVYSNVLLVCLSLFFSIGLDSKVYGAVYIFPIVPGTPEWAELTLAERIAAMQIPEDFLATMSTEDLYQTYLTLPGWNDHLYSNAGPQAGFDMIRARYNVISELMKKPDINEVLIAEYRTYVIDEINNYDFDFLLHINKTELVLNQYESIAKLTKSQKKALFEHALSIYNMRKSLPDSHYFLSYGFILIGRIMLMDAYPPLMQYISENPEFKILLDSELGVERNLMLDMAPDYIDSIVHCEDRAPIACELMPPAPNPFNPITTISFTIHKSAPVKLAVYAISGQRVATLVDETVGSGIHHVTFNGSGLSSGLYVIRLETSRMIMTKKVTLLK